MKKVGLLILILVGGLLLSGMLFTALAQDNTQTIVITVRTNATPPMENWRGNNFILAAKELNADLLLGTDPDCDRMGVAVKADNDFILINGNQIAALLTYYIPVSYTHLTLPTKA